MQFWFRYQFLVKTMRPGAIDTKFVLFFGEFERNCVVDMWYQYWWLLWRIISFVSNENSYWNKYSWELGKGVSNRIVLQPSIFPRSHFFFSWMEIVLMALLSQRSHRNIEISKILIKKLQSSKFNSKWVLVSIQIEDLGSQWKESVVTTRSFGRKKRICDLVQQSEKMWEKDRSTSEIFNCNRESAQKIDKNQNHS